MPGVIEQEEKMSTDQFRALIRKLAATAGQELAWVQVEGVIHGYLDAFFADPRRVRAQVDAANGGDADVSVGGVMAKELVAALRGWFNGEAVAEDLVKRDIQEYADRLDCPTMGGGYICFPRQKPAAV